MIESINLSRARDLISQDPVKRWGIALTNKTCDDVNHSVRQILGFQNLIAPGDYLISTMTLPHCNVINGDRFIVEELGRETHVEERVRGISEPVRVRLQEITIKNTLSHEVIKTLVSLDAFENGYLTLPQKQALSIYRSKLGLPSLKKAEVIFDPICNPGVFKWAYCITAQRAQGSEVDEVVLLVRSLNQIKAFPNGTNWLYTAVTRAKKRLWICENNSL